MKRIYVKAIGFWFVLLVLALVNATIRETTYKPLLQPYIGLWAHQISSVTGILLFYAGIFYFLKRQQSALSRNTLFRMGLLWIVMTILFESGMNRYIRHLTLQQVLETYYFWRGDTWFFVLLSLVVSPIVAYSQINKKLS